MRKASTTSNQQTSLFSTVLLTSLQAVSPVSPTARQETERVKRMNATCGPTCLEQLSKFSRVGLWARTFSALLIGAEGWYSTKCKLTWKLRGTKYSRMYFQLVPSTPRTDATGFGLLPTVVVFDSTGAAANMKSTQIKEGSMHSVGLAKALQMGLLPTPQANCSKGMKPENVEIKGGKMYNKNTGQQIQSSLEQWTKMGLLPTSASSEAEKAWAGNNQNSLTRMVKRGELLATPAAQDGKNSTLPVSLRNRDTLPGNLLQAGATGQLNPRFVMEMMGFPPNWTELPFLSGETKV